MNTCLCSHSRIGVTQCSARLHPTINVTISFIQSRGCVYEHVASSTLVSRLASMSVLPIGHHQKLHFTQPGGFQSTNESDPIAVRQEQDGEVSPLQTFTCLEW